MRRAAVAVTLIAACAPPPDPAVYGTPGLADGHMANPWPSAHFEQADVASATGVRLRIDPAVLPVPLDGHAMPMARLDSRDGFSPVGTLVVRLPSWPAGINGATWRDPSPSLAPEAPLRVFDLRRGVRLPYFAEFDAYPQADEAPALLIRPVTPLPEGAWIGVAILGSPDEAPQAFAAVRDGTAEDAGVQAHYDRLFDDLETAGVERSALSFAWDFHVGTAAETSRELAHVVEAVRSAIPDDPSFEPPFTATTFVDADLDPGEIPDPALWRVLRGTLSVPQFLHAEEGDDSDDAGHFRIGDDGWPIERGPGTAYVDIAVPVRLRDAAAGSVPVVIFGHGIFSNPRQYLSEGGDPESVLALLDRVGAIGIGTEWRGLTTRDAADALRVARDFGRFPLITDKLQQGVAQTLVLERLVRTALRDHPAFAASGGGSLIDPDRILYFGISLGGIEGAVTTALSEHIRASVLHVPGSSWSAVLERSSHWANFESFVAPGVPSAWERQLLYAVSQLFWDPVDPGVYVDALRGRPVLLQMAVGDEQVPNFSTWTLARGLGLPLLTPTDLEVWGLTTDPGPLPAGSSALMHFHPDVSPLPPESNRPAEENGAHKSIRHWESAQVQVERFFEAGAEGSVWHPCTGACVGEP